MSLCSWAARTTCSSISRGFHFVVSSCALRGVIVSSDRSRWSRVADVCANEEEVTLDAMWVELMVATEAELDGRTVVEVFSEREPLLVHLSSREILTVFEMMNPDERADEFSEAVSMYLYKQGIPISKEATWLLDLSIDMERGVILFCGVKQSLQLKRVWKKPACHEAWSGVVEEWGFDIGDLEEILFNSAAPLTGLRVGDIVRIGLPTGKKPVFGLGEVSPGDIGSVVSIEDQTIRGNRVVVIKFPKSPRWMGLESELALVRRSQLVLPGIGKGERVRADPKLGERAFTGRYAWPLSLREKEGLVKKVDYADNTLRVSIDEDDEEYRWVREELVVRATEIDSQ